MFSFTNIIYGNKLIVAVYRLYEYQKNHKVHSENDNSLFTMILSLILLGLCYAFLYFYIYLPKNILIIIFVLQVLFV